MLCKQNALRDGRKSSWFFIPDQDNLSVSRQLFWSSRISSSVFLGSMRRNHVFFPTGEGGIHLDMDHAKFTQNEAGKVLSVIDEGMSVLMMIAQCESAL